VDIGIAVVGVKGEGGGGYVRSVTSAAVEEVEEMGSRAVGNPGRNL
jgi:hypothetical protein